MPEFIDSLRRNSMSLVINTNIASLDAQNNLNVSQAALQTSLQRLSSGLRINSAKDDAAGLAISQRFTAQINGSDQAARNANDGISLAQTAEGSLSATTDNLQRIRQLAVQAANATNSSSDRAALQTEVSQLKSEIDRVGNSASFNGVSLLNGSNSNFVFQVGANTTSNDTITVSGLPNATLAGLTTSVAQYSQATSGAVTAATPIAGGSTDFIKINGVDIGAVATGATATAQGDALVTAVNSVTATTGVTATDNAGVVTFTSALGQPAATITTGGAGTTLLGTLATATSTSTTTSLANLDVSTFDGAQLAIQLADGALNSINSARATLGAVQDRFTSVVSNLQTTSENLSASRSRIQDTDFAAETANLTKNQILQQAGTAILAQANSLPNNVLSLLKS